MPAGRTCAGEGCKTRLSVYNRDIVCALCDKAGARVTGSASDRGGEHEGVDRAAAR